MAFKPTQKTAEGQRMMNLQGALASAEELVQLIKALVKQKPPSTKATWDWGHAGDAGHLEQAVGDALGAAINMSKSSHQGW
jgi:hypothetical protein